MSCGAIAPFVYGEVSHICELPIVLQCRRSVCGESSHTFYAVMALSGGEWSVPAQHGIGGHIVPLSPVIVLPLPSFVVKASVIAGRVEMYRVFM